MGASKVDTFLLSYNNSAFMFIDAVSSLHAYFEVKYIFTNVLKV